MRGVVLLVDDDPRETELIEEAIIAAGVPTTDIRIVSTVESAVGFLLALRKLGHGAEHIPRLVLLDLKLALGESGLELLRALRDIPALQHVPVVMLTNSAIHSDIVESYADGANAYLVKPPDLDRLRETVSTTVLFWLGRNELPPRTHESLVYKEWPPKTRRPIRPA